MEFSVVLNHLQTQFSGQLVLYANDIAKVLGKSEKAIAHLIARDQLPFKVKMLGGLRCVDIFQVAQWLASEQEVAQEVVASPAKVVKSLAAVKRPKVQKTPKVVPNGSVAGAQAKPGSMAASILAMRHDAPQAMARFASRLRNVDEMAFMNEVLEQLFYPADFLTSNYVVTLKKFAPKTCKVLVQETRSYFPSEDHASDFLVVKLVGMRDSKNSRIAHLRLEHDTDTLFHAVVTNSKLDILNNSMSLALPGL